MLESARFEIFILIRGFTSVSLVTNVEKTLSRKQVVMKMEFDVDQFDNSRELNTVFADCACYRTENGMLSRLII